MKSVKAAIYARVSTQDQHCEMQLTELREYAERQGWEIVEYVEHASGKGGGRRPVLDRLMADAAMKRVDVVLVWKLDRFGRSLKHIMAGIETLDAGGVRFMAPSMGIDTDKRTPMGNFLLQIIAAFAELERELIRERVNAGIQEYKRAYSLGQIGVTRKSRSGKNLPTGRPAKIFPRDRAAAMRRKGMSWRAIEKALGVPQSTIRAALAVA
jgi:putative DNA-invertase from lambdoid prophage Rac